MDNPIQKMFENRNRAPDEALFFWTGGPLQVAPSTWFTSLFSGCTAFQTAEGLVLVDCGAEAIAPSMARELRTVTDQPVHTAIYTHGHIDHAYGLSAFLVDGQSPPRVIAHRNMQERFDRYRQTPGHNRTINARQFGGSSDTGGPIAAIDSFRAPAIPPTETYQDSLELRVGELSLQLHHCRGETDDHTWVYCPENGVLCTGDLFIYAVPNAGNPQKAQRYPWDWAAGLRAMAALNPRTMCPGHGGPVVDSPAKIHTMLTETADYLDQLVRDTLALIEDGSPPHVDIVTRVRPPTSQSPWLQPVYDEAEFIVRNIIRYYSGWWSGRPSELKPAPRDQLAAEIARALGGAGALIARANELADAGDWRLAGHLADFALEAGPDHADVRTAVADFYRRRARRQTSLMATNIFNAAASYAERGKPFR